jgi:hypothetical protein
VFDAPGSKLAYREPEKRSKYSKTPFIWGEDANEKAMSTEEGRKEREKIRRQARRR